MKGAPAPLDPAPTSHAPQDDRFEEETSCVSITTGAALPLGAGIVTGVESTGATDGAPSSAAEASNGAHAVSFPGSQSKWAHLTR
jgi:molybdopterin biosynthesis enzyme